MTRVDACASAARAPTIRHLDLDPESADLRRMMTPTTGPSWARSIAP